MRKSLALPHTCVVTTTTVRPSPALTRDSYAAERPAGETSPFRSYQPNKRYLGALAMVAKRQEEIVRLQRALARAADLKTQKRLAERLLATVNNLRSWEAYLSGENERDEACYREKRAVIIP